MNVQLVDNLILPQEGSLARLDVHPHLGLLALAAVAEADGHDVQIFDPKRLIRSGELPYDATLYERVAEDLLSRPVDMVGFTTLGCSFLFALGVAEIIKRRDPAMPVLFGGPHATMLHRQILERFEQVDVVVRHEADEIFPAVLAGLERRAFDDIPGISWRTPERLRFTDGKPKVQDLDSLPFVTYDHYPVAELGLDLLRIEAGRGCPFNCTFCSTAMFFQRSFRLKSAARLVKELDILHERYGFVDFKLDHDMFTVNKRKVREFCEAVEGRGYRWRASARVDCVDVDLLTKMAESGCVGLYFGIETGSVRMQKICQKRLDLDLVEPILDAATGLGIETTASFITGYPEETASDQNDTLDLLGRCFRRSCLPQLHMLAPEPGTPMFDQLGATIEYDGYSGRYNAEPVGTHDEALVRSHPDIFQTYYFYPAAMPRPAYVFAVEAVDALRRLGPLVVRYLLRAYDGKLSELVDDLRRFATATGPGDRPDAAMVQRYVEWRFGAGHHVTSLVRFALAATPAGRDVEDDRRHPVFEAHLPYRLSRDVQLLTDLHDCVALLERIERDPERPDLLEEPAAGERGAYLLMTSGGTTTSCRIDAGVQVILDAVSQEPHTCSEVSRWLCDAAGLAELDQGFFADLVQAGVLEPDRA